MALKSSIIGGAILTFVIGQISTFGKNIKWTDVKANADQTVNQDLPWAFLDPIADTIVNDVIDGVAFVLQDQKDLVDVATKVAAQDWAGALATMEALAAKAYAAATAGGAAAPAHLAALMDALKH